MYPKVQEAVGFIRARVQRQPVIGVILGSGLGALADALQDRVVIPFGEIPHFPPATVPGHAGRLVLGDLESLSVAVLQGRVHLYEGYSAAEAAFPAWVLGFLGIRNLIVTNAAGAVNLSFKPGDLMLITDHINLTGANPLAGLHDEALGPRFPDMSEAYDRTLRETALAAGAEKEITLRQGIYAGVMGPSYETPAEIRMLRLLGADAVGMSTIPEVIAAAHMGIPVLGISCITNMAAGILPGKLTHKEVMDAADRAGERLRTLVREVIKRLAGSG